MCLACLPSGICLSACGPTLREKERRHEEAHWTKKGSHAIQVPSNVIFLGYLLIFKPPVGLLLCASFINKFTVHLETSGPTAPTPHLAPVLSPPLGAPGQFSGL